MGGGGAWGTELESKREGSTLGTGGSPPLGEPLWYPPAPVEMERKKYSKCWSVFPISHIIVRWSIL